MDEAMGAQFKLATDSLTGRGSAISRDRIPRRRSSRRSSARSGTRGSAWGTTSGTTGAVATGTTLAAGTRTVVLTRTVEAGGRSTVATSLLGTDTHHAVVDGSLNGVVLLVVHLGEHVVVVEGGITDVTHRGCFHYVSNHETLHCLVLWDVLAREHAHDTLHVTAVLLVTPVVAPLLRHDS